MADSIKYIVGLPGKTVLKLPHHYVVNTNLFTTDESSIQSFTTTTRSTTYPYPIYEGTRKFTIDPGLQRVREKTQHIHKLALLKRRYNIVKQSKIARKNEANGIYSDRVYRYAKLLESDPQPDFEGTYDWYNTGGTLCHFTNSKNKLHLIHSSGPENDVLNISRLTDKGGLIRRNEKKSIRTSIDHETSINEIKYSQEHRLIGCRQQKGISLFYNFPQTKNERNLDNLLKIKSKIPFISFSFEKLRNDRISTTDMSGVIKIFDIAVSYKKPIISEQMPNSDGQLNWNRLENIDNDFYLYCSKKNLGIFDVRSSPGFVYNFSMEKFVDSCENITSISSPSIQNTIIASTTHRTFTVDLRFWKNDQLQEFSINPTSCWTHQLQIPPIIIKQCDDLVAIASPLAEEVRLIEINEPGKRYIVPKSISDTRHAARLKGKLLNPMVPLKERTKLCTAGLEIVKIREKTIIALQNTAGDIFCQEVVDEINDLCPSSPVLEKMDKWECSLKNDCEANVPATDLANFESLTNILCSNRISDIPYEDEPIREKRYPRWKRPLSVLAKYTDALAADMMSIWDFENSDVTEVVMPNVPDKEEAGNNFVENWLAGTTVQINNDIKDEIPFEIDKVFSLSENAIANVTPAVKKNTRKRATQGF